MPRRLRITTNMIPSRSQRNPPVMSATEAKNADAVIKFVAVPISKREVPAVGFNACCKDSVGNMFHLFEGFVPGSSR
jgi:hypothetical protein